MEADARAHPDDEVAQDERHHFHDVDGVGAKPEDTGHGTRERKADQEGIVDSLLESHTPRKDATGLNNCGGLAGTGYRHSARSICLESLRERSPKQSGFLSSFDAAGRR